MDRLPVKLALAFTVSVSLDALPIIVLPLNAASFVTVRAVPLPVIATEPCKVVVTPDLPSVRALAFDVPSKRAPVVPVAVPESIVIPPELLVVPSALPVCTLMLFEFVDAAFVLPLETFAAWKAYGTAVTFMRLPVVKFVISVSHVGDPALPPTRIVTYS